MAKLKHDDIVIPDDNPFANCKLNRQPYAEVLTDIVSNYSDGFVMAINNEWGTGKTTFAKMWQQYLKNQGFQTLYFNAWENDFEDDVLVALLSELKELTKDQTDKVFKEVVKRAAPLAKKLLPSIAKALAKRYVGDEFVQEIIEGVTEVSAEGLEAELKSYANRKDNIQLFKESLEKFVKQTDPNKPVVFILDELDRCRPNYAVRVLEQIKHLFSVQGIVFILSIDKVQLGHAVRGVYGSDQIDADEYLRRFIDIEYTIPAPNQKNYSEYLFDYYDFASFFKVHERNQYNTDISEYRAFIDFSIYLFQVHNIGLRGQNKLMAKARLVMRSFEDCYSFPQVILILLFARQYKSQLYMDIVSRRITQANLVDKLENEILLKITDNILNTSMLFGEALFFYIWTSGSIGKHHQHALYRVVDEKVEFFFEIDKKSNRQEAIKDVLISLPSKRAFMPIYLESIVKKIELIDAIEQ